MKCKILMTEFVTHDTKSFILEKPKGIKYIPGQATEINIDKDKWRDEKRPFTFTSLTNDNVLQFIIKEYPGHDAVTEELHKLKPGDYIELGDVFGAIQYKGKGVFIAGGAGVTPFIAILRDLREKGQLEGNMLIFSNKKAKDIILEKEFIEMLGDNFITTLTQEKSVKHSFGRIDKDFIKKYVSNFKQNFYVCGPPSFVEDISKELKSLGAEVKSIVIEE